MGVGNTLGIIFAVVLIFIAIALAIWFYVFRRPPAVGQSCQKDADCSDSSASFVDQYQGLRCIKGTCQSTPCQNNGTCASRLPGSTCFGYSSQAGSSSCIPLSCRTTNDCVPEGQNVEDANVVCVFSQTEGRGVCVPTNPKGGGCYDITGLSQDSNGNCVVCSDSQPCPPGSYCDSRGRCLRCGNSTDNLCESRTGTLGAGAWNLCSTNATGACGNIGGAQTLECTREIDGQVITLPDGTQPPENVGLCLPEQAECAFSWFNTEASLTGPNPVPGGWCSISAPFCSSQGQCEQTPVAGGGTVCGEIPGNYENGVASNGYDLTGICSGRLLPANAFTNIANFTTNGNLISGKTSRCQNNVSRSGGLNSCGCQTNPSGNDNLCPGGTVCIPFSAANNQSLQADGTYDGLCLITTGPTGGSTGAANSPFAPQPGEPGYLYSNSQCLPNSNLGGLATCVQVTSTNAQTSPTSGGPGDFCWSTSQCLYQGQRQAPNSDLGALRCSTNNICIGAF